MLTLEGLRTSKTVGGVTHNYLYAGGKLMRETYGSNTLDFFYDANGTPYALKHNGTVYYYITNLQGDVTYLVNASGTAVATYEYDPYGKVTTATGTLAQTNPLRYRGYYYDNDTGMYYLQSRYYDPAVGRFINADSYASTGKGIIGHNMYAYCLNNPTNNTDPLGSDPVAIGIAVVAVVGILIVSAVVLQSGQPLVENAVPACNQFIAQAKDSVSNALSEVRAYAKSLADSLASRFENHQPRIHHIVPQGSFAGRGKEINRMVLRMHDILENAGINPKTDPLNLVVLSHGCHKYLHTNDYITRLYNDLLKAEGDGDAVRWVLYCYRIILASDDQFAPGY